VPCLVTDSENRYQELLYQVVRLGKYFIRAKKQLEDEDIVIPHEVDKVWSEHFEYDKRNEVKPLVDDTVEALKITEEKITQALCFLCGDLRALGILMESPRGLQKWAGEHHANDEVRVLSKMKRYFAENPDTQQEELANIFIEKAELVHPVSLWHKNWFLRLASRVMLRACKTKKVTSIEKGEKL
jgi:hypothetical protein